MNTRLTTTNPELAQRINSASLWDAKALVWAVLGDVLAELPDEVVQGLPNGFDMQAHSVSQDQIEALDAQYFDLEEKGDAESAAACFMGARFLAAVRAWQSATTHFELCEAAYEAGFAVELRS